MRKKKWIKLTLFTILFIVLFSWISNATTPERIGEVTWDEYYGLSNNSVDVLIIGSSKVNHTYNPLIINQAMGLDSYCLSGHGMGIDGSYYVLKEAFKSQSPKVVVLELYSAIPKDDKAFATSGLRLAIDKMNFSVNKATAILSNVPLEDSLPYFVPFTNNHTRWKEMSFQDFFNYNSKVSSFQRYFGYYAVNNCVDEADFEPLIPDYLSDNSIYPHLDKEKAVLKKITALCEKNGAELVYVVSPYFGTKKFSYVQMHQVVNGIRDDAEADGIPIIDYNTMLLSGDLTHCDFTDPNHTNTLGAEKVSLALVDSLMGLFPDLAIRCLQDIDISEQLSEYQTVVDEFKNSMKE